MFLSMEVTLTYFQLLLVYHKVLYGAHYFSLFISMIYLMLLRNLLFYLFADDTNIYYESKDLSNLTKVVNKELRLLSKWREANKLSLNSDKTNYIIFHSSSVNVPSGSDIKIGKKHIKELSLLSF